MVEMEKIFKRKLLLEKELNILKHSLQMLLKTTRTITKETFQDLFSSIEMDLVVPQWKRKC